jgi:hypothetical protein
VNGDILLLARLGGKVVKHNHDQWWSAHPDADRLIPG